MTVSRLNNASETSGGRDIPDHLGQLTKEDASNIIDTLTPLDTMQIANRHAHNPCDKPHRYTVG